MAKKPNIVIKPVAGQQKPAPMTDAELRNRIRMNATQRFEQYAQGILYNILSNKSNYIAEGRVRVNAADGVEHHVVDAEALKENVRAAIDAALDGAGYLLTVTGEKLDPVVDALVDKYMAERSKEQEETETEKEGN